jgi:hypothetical protein
MPLAMSPSISTTLPFVLLATMLMILVCVYRINNDLMEVKSGLHQLHDSLGGMCEHRYSTATVCGDDVTGAATAEPAAVEVGQQTVHASSVPPSRPSSHVPFSAKESFSAPDAAASSAAASAAAAAAAADAPNEQKPAPKAA